MQYRFVNALNAVSATVRPDQLALLRAAPEVAGVYPVRKLYPAGIVAEQLASLGAAARPVAVGGADGKGMRVALLDGPVDGGHPYLHSPAPGWNAVNGKPQAAEPDPRGHGARHGHGRDRRRPRRPRRPARRRAGRDARSRFRCSSCSTAN